MDSIVLKQFNVRQKFKTIIICIDIFLMTYFFIQMKLINLGSCFDLFCTGSKGDMCNNLKFGRAASRTFFIFTTFLRYK